MTLDARTPPKKRPQSEGARLLLIETLKSSQNEVARQLDATSSQVNRWIRCLERPGTAWAVKIHQVLGIEVIAWTQPPRKPIDFEPHM